MADDRIRVLATQNGKEISSDQRFGSVPDLAGINSGGRMNSARTFTGITEMKWKHTSKAVMPSWKIQKEKY